jgi:arsenate reductase-like glutaredoxin family protein
MKRLSVLAILSALAISGIITSISSHQIYAPRNCGSCAQFKKLTNEFEKNVIDIGSQSPPEPDRIQTLLDQYNDDVIALFRTPSISP